MAAINGKCNNSNNRTNESTIDNDNTLNFIRIAMVVGRG